MMGAAMPPGAIALVLAVTAMLTISSRHGRWMKASEQGCPEWLPWSVFAALGIGIVILGVLYPDAIVAVYNENHLFPG
jgi:hypothetical protein